MEYNFVHISWAQVEEFVDNVAEHFKGKVNGVYGLPRGGLVFAVMISYRLNIPLLLAPIKGCLIVDDLADTGESLKHYKSRKYQIATMHYNERSCVEPDYYMIKNSHENWIIYPWEREDGDNGDFV